ncbi:DNA repair protein RAD51 homolog 3-like [Glandiceps talaboti]
MQRDVATFPFPPDQKRKLQQAGFQTVGDLLEVSPVELSKELDVSKEEALEILQLVRRDDNCVENKSTHSKTLTNKSMTALEKLKQEKNLPCIITFCEELDEILGGGVPLTKITEFCGAPGIGKTQLGIQLCVDVQIPSLFAGVEGEAVYIDTEGSFMVQRVMDIAKGTVSHCQHITQLENTPEQKEAQKMFTVESILSGIYVFRCNDYIELLATINLLPEFVQQHKIKLVVVDSIAFHFRHNFDDMALRTRLLNGLAQNLIRMASQYQLAVVLTNQMTTKIASEGKGQSHLAPALGESWGHASTIRVVLFWQNNQRYARLYKSPSRKDATIPYQITMNGIRSACLDPTQQNITTEQLPVTTQHLPTAQQCIQHDRDNELSSSFNPRKRLRPDD